MRIDISLILLVVGLSLGLFAFKGDIDSGEAEQYCDMRKIWTESNKEFGWPEGAGGLDDGVCK